MTNFGRLPFASVELSEKVKWEKSGMSRPIVDVELFFPYTFESKMYALLDYLS